MLALVAGLAPSVAWAQDCQEDADCGHGFQCIHESAGTASVTSGVGGSMQAECGDGICEFGAEDVESCPQDCDTLQYCAPAECESHADCAEGYECGEEIGSNSGFSSAGGSSSSVCGDSTCDFDEDYESCSEDCPLVRLCQVMQVACNSNADCAEGFYCYFVAGVNSANSTSGGVDSTSGSSDAAAVDSGSGNDSGSGDTDAGSGGTSGFAPPADDTTSGTSGGDELGVCVEEVVSDSGSSSDNVGSTGSTIGGTSGPTGTNGDDTDGGSASSAANGAGGANVVAGNGSPATSGSDGDASGSDGEASSGSGTGSGSDVGGAGSDPDAAGESSDDDGGCSCAVLGVQSSSGLLGAALFGLVAGIRRRRSARA